VNAAVCCQCGLPFDSSATDTERPETLDFVVTEANGEDREFVGGKSAFEAGIDDDLGIETTSDLMNNKARREANHQSEGENHLEMDLGPIGDSTPPPPPESDYDSPANETFKTVAPTTSSADSSDQLKKLSEDEIKNIEKNLYKKDSFVTDREKQEILRKIDDTDRPFGNTPITPPKKQAAEKASDTPVVPTVPTTLVDSDIPHPKMAGRGKGIAYYYRNYIQLAGEQDIFPNDDLTVGDRSYQLKPKKIKPAYLFGGAAAVFVLVLLIIASQFVGNAGPGAGAIVGMALDEYAQPYVRGATIRFPDLGKSFKSNPEGFFITDPLPSGSHKIEYLVDGVVVRTDYATIAGDKISTISLAPGQESTEHSQIESEPVQVAQVPEQSQFEPVQPEAARPTTTTSQKTKSKKSSSTSGKSSKPSTGKVTLTANVEGARLELDGTVMGAGNLTYSRIKTGVHGYVVSADGYHPVEGDFKLTGGENHTLAVALEPLTEAEKRAAFTAEDFFYSGNNALRKGSYKAAVTDFTEAINRDPGYADAWFHRGKALAAAKEFKQAAPDFHRAGEIYRMANRNGDAITCFTEAMSADKKLVAAYLGRAETFLAQGEEIAAVADYKQTIKLDKRNFQAHYGMGQARFKQGQYKSAIDHFKDARSLEPNNPNVYAYLMLSHLARDDVKKVQKTFDKFAKVATEEQMNQFVSNQKYAAVVRIVKTD